MAAKLANKQFLTNLVKNLVFDPVRYVTDRIWYILSPVYM